MLPRKAYLRGAVPKWQGRDLQYYFMRWFDSDPRLQAYLIDT